MAINQHKNINIVTSAGIVHKLKCCGVLHNMQQQAAACFNCWCFIVSISLGCSLSMVNRQSAST